MKWVKLRVDNQEDRLRIAAALCESGYKVYCKSVRSTYTLSMEHYVCVLLTPDEIMNEDED